MSNMTFVTPGKLEGWKITLINHLEDWKKEFSMTDRSEERERMTEKFIESIEKSVKVIGGSGIKKTCQA